jgi:hypothetical protein
MTVFHLVIVPPPPPLAGLRTTSHQGAVTSSQTVTRALIGQAITSTQGTVTAIKTGLGPLLGMQITSGRGGITVSQAVSRALTGSAITSTKGAVSPQRPLTAQGKITSQKGTVGHSRSLSLLGRTFTSHQGSITAQNTAALSIVQTAMTDATVGSAYSYQFTATGGSGSYVWSLDFMTPDTGNWLAFNSINASTGVLTGTPGTAETESIGVRVHDAVTAVEATKTFALNVHSGGLDTITAKMLIQISTD